VRSSSASRAIERGRMLLLESSNVILTEQLKLRLSNPSEEVAFEHVFADFDGVLFKLNASDTAKHIIRLSMAMKCYSTCIANGGAAVLSSTYAGLVSTDTEPNFDVTLQISLKALPSDTATLISNLAALKRNIMGAPFNDFFDKMATNPPATLAIPYRGDESMWLVPNGKEQVTVVFSVKFVDLDDVILAKVFLQEFQDARRNVRTAPAVTYSKVPPQEIVGLPNVREAADTAFISFVVFAHHIVAKSRATTITNVLMFRDYLLYHIKCTKAFMHTRMRSRVVSLLQVLNRAKPDDGPKEKKTATGKTFVRS